MGEATTLQAVLHVLCAVVALFAASACGDSGAPGGSGASSAAGGTNGSDGSAGSSGAVDGGSGDAVLIDCTTDEQCRTSGLVCDPLPGRCVQCLFDRDCPADQRCVDRQCRASAPCTNSLDCESAPFGQKICDAATGRCVGCVSNADCTANHECSRNDCIAFAPCEASRDCAAGQHCDTKSGRCVECVGDADCGAGHKCANQHCVSACAIDATCPPEHPRCDKTDGHCARCLEHADCPEQYHCVSGECVLDTCVSDSSRCTGNTALFRCTSIGDGWLETSCQSRQSCSASNGSASCVDWVCSAGQTECDAAGKTVVTCAADGLGIVSRIDCAASGQICLNAQCRKACVPSARFCENDAIKQCGSDGLSTTIVESCTPNQYCDDATTTCRTRICTPDQPGCDDSRRTSCNSNGSGWLSGGTDCASLAASKCSGGACICFAGYGDCDGIAATGCEVFLATSAAHCGECDAPCSTNHVTPACSGTVCSGVCSPGFDDCDGDKRNNGCETPVSDDAQNCGACARACSPANMATISCAAGTCNGTCAPGYADCDGNKLTNGCEQSTQSFENDPDHCGSCSASCSSTNMATRSCGSGNCNGTCASGFLDCDGNKLTNGCETNTKNDPSHCNGCNRPCSTGQVCFNGSCSTCNNRVLLLGDSGTFSGSHNAALKSALEASGLVATVVTSGVANYSDVPAASGFGAILIPVGNSYDGPDMPSAGQSAIVNANAAGKGVLFDGWATLKAYFNTPPQWTTLRQLLLMQYTGNTHNSFESPYSPQRILYTLTSAGHPIWDGLTSPFATQVSLHTIMGPATNSGVEVAFSDLEDFGYGDGPGVVVRTAPGGRIVQLAHASNSRLSAFDPRPVRWFDDPNLLKMFVNAAKWLTRCQ